MAIFFCLYKRKAQGTASRQCKSIHDIQVERNHWGVQKEIHIIFTVTISITSQTWEWTAKWFDVAVAGYLQQSQRTTFLTCSLHERPSLKASKGLIIFILYLLLCNYSSLSMAWHGRECIRCKFIPTKTYKNSKVTTDNSKILWKLAYITACSIPLFYCCTLICYSINVPWILNNGSFLLTFGLVVN